MNRKRLLKRTVLILCLMVAVFGAAAHSYLANDPGALWQTVNGARVTLNGSAVRDAKIYRRRNGILLMNLGAGNGWQLYRPDTQVFPGAIQSNTCQFQGTSTQIIATRTFVRAWK